MEHRKIHAWEKLQVQLLALAGLCAVYLLAWPILRASDPQMPAAYLWLQSHAQLIFLGLLIVSACIVMGIATAASRPQAALLAGLVAVAGVSLKSPGIRSLLWYSQDYSSLYVTMMIETLVLGAVLAVGAYVAGVSRIAAGRISYRLKWVDPVSQLQIKGKPQPQDNVTLVQMLKALPAALAGRGKSSPAAQAATAAIGCLLANLALSTLLVIVAMQSNDRGQIVFALAISFFLGCLVAHQYFPTRFDFVAWICPVLLGLAFYALAAASAPGQAQVREWINGTGQPAWTLVSQYGLALPIDWIACGGAGAMFGLWASSRIHEAKLLSETSAKKNQ